MRSRLLLLLLLLLPALVVPALAGCAADSPADDGTLSIVTSTNVYGDIASAIGGDLVEVTAIIDDPDRDPHEYEADARTQLALSRADIVIENGGGYDDFMDTMLSAAGNDRATVLDAVKLSGYDTDPADGEFNEHVWYDYPTMRVVAQKLAEALAAADPANADAYRANAATFGTGLDGLTASVAELKARVAGEGVAITEPVPLYLLDALGLENRTPEAFSEAIEEDTDVAPGVLQQTINLFTRHEVVLLVDNEQTTGPQTEAVLTAASDAGIPRVPVTETLPAGMHYLDWQAGLIARIAAALAR